MSRRKVIMKEERCCFCNDVARHTAIITVYYFSDSIEDEYKQLCDEHYSHRKEMSYDRETGI
tara:strand:- start:29 stop:214 length:186 start_codon:yes stop_codon:yes gene_type:complete